MDFNSFLTSLGMSFAIFAVLMLLFTCLSRRPGNNVVYYPNRILKELEPVENGHLSRNLFSWIREALSSTEADIISISGVDTAVYFVFLNTGKKSAVWAFIIATYWVSFVAYFFLWKAYKHIVDLRVEALMSSEVRAEQFAILVRDIPPVPKGQSRKEQVDSYFSTIYPETFYGSMVVTDNKKGSKRSLNVQKPYMHSRKKQIQMEQDPHIEPASLVLLVKR